MPVIPAPMITTAGFRLTWVMRTSMIVIFNYDFEWLFRYTIIQRLLTNDVICPA